MTTKTKNPITDPQPGDIVASMSGAWTRIVVSRYKGHVWYFNPEALTWKNADEERGSNPVSRLTGPIPFRMDLKSWSDWCRKNRGYAFLKAEDALPDETDVSDRGAVIHHYCERGLEAYRKLSQSDRESVDKNLKIIVDRIMT